jgi:hypothetical protein
VRRRRKCEAGGGSKGGQFGCGEGGVLVVEETDLLRGDEWERG